jgi:hypothetical protein
VVVELLKGDCKAEAMVLVQALATPPSWLHWQLQMLREWRPGLGYRGGFAQGLMSLLGGECLRSLMMHRYNRFQNQKVELAMVPVDNQVP